MKTMPPLTTIIICEHSLDTFRSCSLLEMGGPCEQCSLSRGWCAMTSECGTDDGSSWLQVSVGSEVRVPCFFARHLGISGVFSKKTQLPNLHPFADKKDNKSKISWNLKGDEVPNKFSRRRVVQ